MSRRDDDLSTSDFAEPRTRTDEESPDLHDEVHRERRDEAEFERRDDLPDDRPRERTGPGPVAAEPGEPELAPERGAATAGTAVGPLLAPDAAESFRAQWTDVQNGFVDSPRKAVEQADGLVAELMQHLARTFADERGRLEGQWDRGDDVSTDDLRTAFQRYRSFFERLLAT
jgi:hypothetical protein